MTKPRNDYKRIKPLIDVLLDRLLNDKEFRQAFFINPENEAKKLDIKLDPLILKKLKNFQCPTTSTNVANFDERLVLCSSAPG